MVFTETKDRQMNDCEMRDCKKDRDYDHDENKF